MIRVFRGPGQPSPSPCVALAVLNQDEVESFSGKHATLYKVIGVIAAAILIGVVYKTYCYFWQERQVREVEMETELVSEEEGCVSRRMTYGGANDLDIIYKSKIEFYKGYIKLKMIVKDQGMMSADDFALNYAPLQGVVRNNLISISHNIYYFNPMEYGLSENVYYTDRERPGSIEVGDQNKLEKLLNDSTYKPLQIEIIKQAEL